MNHSILIVEDDAELAVSIADYLSSQNYRCRCIENGADAVVAVQKEKPDLILLDGMLPGMDGFDVCKTVRSFYSGPIIMLTARDDEIDEVLGLEVGADDYLVKPVRARALLTRIRKLLDSNSSDSATQSLTFGRLVIDFQSRAVHLNNEKVDISSKEFDVLWYLASSAGTIIEREDLVQEFRGYGFDGYDRSIDLRISRLRKKLKDDKGDLQRIKTVWGRGYLFVKDAW